MGLNTRCALQICCKLGGSLQPKAGQHGKHILLFRSQKDEEKWHIPY